MPDEVYMPDADAIDEEQRLYGSGPLTEQELNEKYPTRPHNHSKTLPFHELFLSLFNPLNENRKRPSGPAIARRKHGPHGPRSAASPNEQRRQIIERFISRWRREVGNDIYPALRLIVPEKDRDRGMYGLKEKTIGKLLIKIMQIDKNSEDGNTLLNWKQPGQHATSGTVGDFAGRCYGVLSKRPMRTTVGSMSIGEVNEKLDKLSVAQKDEYQIPIFQHFYSNMNPEEIMWLIRIILRQMKIGATETTIFDLWHTDADKLFNVSSSLKRVCWDLYDPSIRLEADQSSIHLMQCFQPQLAQFQMHSIEKMVARVKPTEEDNTYWIEEKLDGERMQMHMVEDDSVPGGMSFRFWSRKAKDYTYLYGNGFQDENGALTRQIKGAFKEGVRNIILDGEMITWDPEQDAMVPFGTLKSAALDLQKNPFSQGIRPLYRVFDCLYLNGKDLTKYTLRDRRRALEASIETVHRWLEVHAYKEATEASEVEPMLRQVVAEASEGLILKNPRSPYRLNERRDDWMKVKPEYMTEFGEALDCIVIGGFYGSGHRGGRVSSFLCGLRVDQAQIQHGARPEKCFSFFKVGGGMTAADYANIRHHTEGKWIEWDPRKPPTEWIELAGGDRQFERPDVWIKPQDSVVIEVKAASVNPTDQMRMGLTLRFPRFKRIRTDKDWRTALSIQDFMQLKSNVAQEQKEKQFKIDDARRRRHARPAKRKTLTVSGTDEVQTPFAGPTTKVFGGLNFFVVTEALKPERKSKAELEEFVKANGGKIFQTHTAAENIICVADRQLVRVASIQKSGKHSIVRPSWLFDCAKQNQKDIGRPVLVLPFEPEHMMHVIDEDVEVIRRNVDEFGDSYVQDVTATGLRSIFDDMPKTESHSDTTDFLGRIEDDAEAYDDGADFRNCVVYLDKEGTTASNNTTTSGHGTPLDMETNPELEGAGYIVRFAGGTLAKSIDDPSVTHIVVKKKNNKKSRASEIRRSISSKARLPRIVTVDWVEQSWKEKTLLDEERFVPS